MCGRDAAHRAFFIVQHSAAGEARVDLDASASALARASGTHCRASRYSNDGLFISGGIAMAARNGVPAVIQ